MFRWQSRGDVSAYKYDEDSAKIAREPLMRLIKLLQQQRVSEIHILAHSMGNQIVLDALAQLSSAFEIAPISELIMAAPDVDRDVMKILVSKVRQFTRGMTLYASSTDKALQLSSGLSQNPRAGDVPPDGPLVVVGMDTIDISALGDNPLGINHSTFAASRSLIDDIGRLIRDGKRPPGDRSPQIRGVPEGAVPPSFWRYVP